MGVRMTVKNEDDGKECPTCKKKSMFVNQANSLTCENCGQLIFPCSAEEHRKLMCLITETHEFLKRLKP